MLNIINIIYFIGGGSIGAVMGAFIASSGKRNKELENYYQGFLEGYRKKAKQINDNKVDK